MSSKSQKQSKQGSRQWWIPTQRGTILSHQRQSTLHRPPCQPRPGRKDLLLPVQRRSMVRRRHISPSRYQGPFRSTNQVAAFHLPAIQHQASSHRDSRSLSLTLVHLLSIHLSTFHVDPWPPSKAHQPLATRSTTGRERAALLVTNHLGIQTKGRFPSQKSTQRPTVTSTTPLQVALSPLQGQTGDIAFGIWTRPSFWP